MWIHNLSQGYMILILCAGDKEFNSIKKRYDNVQKSAEWVGKVFVASVSNQKKKKESKKT